jgi:hypothetical protein
MKKKQRGKARARSVRDIGISCYHSEGTYDCSLSLLEPFCF